jgi:RNA polymerase sigma-70 factor, ECF subfamily
MATLALSQTNTSARPALDSDVALAASGDRDAFERLYRANSGRVFALCVRMVAERSTAEELTQDVFVRAWSKLGQFRGDSSFSTWLHRLAVNVVLNARKQQGRHRARHEEMDGENDTFAQPGLPVPGTRLDLEAAIATLPPGARKVFVLHDVEGYTHEEIAQELGITAGGSKSQLFKARAKLRKLLAHLVDVKDISISGKESLHVTSTERVAPVY